MISALLVIICLYVVFFYVLPWLGRLLKERMIRKFAAGFGFGFDSDKAGARQNNSRRQSQPRSRKKKIDPSMGEYVAFEEIKDSGHDHRAASASQQSGKPYNESQIVDAEWEDIKN